MRRSAFLILRSWHLWLWWGCSLVAFALLHLDLLERSLVLLRCAVSVVALYLFELFEFFPLQVSLLDDLLRAQLVDHICNHIVLVVF